MLTNMAFAFLLLLCSSKHILGEDVMAIEEFNEVKDRVKMAEADEAAELDMGVVDNRTKIDVLDTWERVGKEERVWVKDLNMVKELKEMQTLNGMEDLNDTKELKELGERREKRATFYKSGSELAYQVNKIECEMNPPLLAQVSDTLDQLLVRRGYNKQMRPIPRAGGPVLIIIVSASFPYP